MKNTNAFTLIELLVVIAIIGVLTSLLIAGLGRFQTSGDQVISANNLRQIFTGFAMYAADNNGVWPRHSQAYSPPDPENTNGSWIPCMPASDGGAAPTQRKALADFDVKKGAIYPYLNDEKVFSHPADKRRGLKLSYALAAPIIYTPVGIAPPPGTGKGMILRPMMISRLSQVIFLVEAQGADDGWFVPPPLGSEGVAPTWQNGSICVVMGDGSGRRIAKNSDDYTGKTLWYPEGSKAPGTPWK